jgi:hypothetical protein
MSAKTRTRWRNWSAPYKGFALTGLDHRSTKCSSSACACIRNNQLESYLRDHPLFRRAQKNTAVCCRENTVCHKMKSVRCTVMYLSAPGKKNAPACHLQYAGGARPVPEGTSCYTHSRPRHFHRNSFTCVTRYRWRCPTRWSMMMMPWLSTLSHNKGVMILGRLLTHWIQHSIFARTFIPLKFTQDDHKMSSSSLRRPKEVFALYRSVLREAAKRTVKYWGLLTSWGRSWKKNEPATTTSYAASNFDDKLGWWSDPSLKGSSTKFVLVRNKSNYPHAWSQGSLWGTTAWYGYHRRRCDLREPVMPRWCMKKLPCLTFLLWKERINRL